jgi:uncharacterized membrane protein/cytochrome c551/c552
MPRWLLALILLSAPAGATAQDDAELLTSSGCVACHSLDGRTGVGPTFARELGDEDAITASILEPDATLSPGFSAGIMPRTVTDEAEARRLARAVLAIGRAPVAPPVERAPFWVLLASFVFVALHFVLSSLAVRSRGVAALGERAYLGAYSLLALAGFAWLVFEWRAAPYVELYAPPASCRWVPNLIMPVAYTLLIMGYTIRSPTVAGMAASADGPTGILRITRHPALWGFGLWGLSHLAANGDLRALALFGGIALLSFGGMAHIDARRRATGGEAWARFAAASSTVPLAAILAGRQTWPSLAELGWWRIALGLGGWAVMLFLHGWLIGASPWP